MARATAEVIEALRTTAARLRAGAPYQWGHAGSCNTGHLAQTVTSMSKVEIYSIVAGEWSEYLNDYCGVTGVGLDDFATTMVRFGFELGDLADLEHLRDDRILRRLPEQLRWLQRNDREHVVLYLETWADMLQEQLADPPPDPLEDATAA